MIPSFQADGLLPPGDYEVSFEELRRSILTVGPGMAVDAGSWDAPWRERLVDNFEVLTRQLGRRRSRCLRGRIVCGR